MNEPQQPTPQKAEKGKGYVVLKQGEGGRWLMVEGGAAGSPDAAIKTAAKKHGDGNYAAVAVSRWHQVDNVAVSQETIVKLG